MRFRGKRTNGAINICRRNISFPPESQQSDVAHLPCETCISVQKLFITKRRTTFAVRKNRIERDLFVFWQLILAFRHSRPHPKRCTIDFCSLRTGSANCGGRRRTPRVSSPPSPPSFFAPPRLSPSCTSFLLRTRDLEVDVLSLVRERY